MALPLFLWLLSHFLFNVYGCFGYMYLQAPHACSVLGGQKGASALELELQMVVSHIWVLRTDSRLSAGAVE